VLPRHVQTWVILGIAVLMTGIIALSGSSRPVDKKPAASPGAAALAASDARIQEYRARIDEEARRLSAAQADLDVAKQSLTAPVPATAPTPMPEPTIAAPLDTSVQRERAERAYRSLFADNVAFSLRKQTLANGSSVPVAAPPTPLAAGSSHPAAPATDAVLPMAAPVLPFGSSSSVTAPAVAAPTSAVETKARRYPLLEGTILEAVLTNRLDGTFAGPVNGMVTTAVYARDRQHLLIPQGARLLGEAKSVASFGQQRLAVAFHRLVMPDGATVTLDQFKGLSQVGETGLQDHVNHHYLQLFGVSLAIGAIGGLAQADTRVGLDATGADLSRQGLASSTAQSSLHILDRFLNVLPTVTIREGQRLKVYLSNDLELPAYGASHDE
jgi:type IV secretion system protein VirB10